ncbi:MAG: hypothetical protein ACK4UW_05165 [Rhizobium rhizophilum]|uniref:hypothetical protein n=1 Tax=Rhizobium rhizophilum TaxID=1850373 RepID=UPI00391A9599
MTKTGVRMSFDRAIRMICVVALVLLGLAHRPVAAPAPQLSPDEIAALMLPDGSLPELCLPSDDGKGKPHTAASDCEACRISAAVLLPAPADAVGKRMTMTASVVLPQPAEAHFRQLFPPDTHPRAPPVTA